MREPLSSPDSQDHLFAQLLDECEAATEPQVVLKKFCDSHPALAAQARDVLRLTLNLPTAIPTDLPDFRLIRKIGRGGMGVVYEAEQLSLGRRVAVKFCLVQLGQEARERFLREQHVLAQLHQTHIVPIYTAGRAGRWQYFAMRYIEGAPLHRVLQSTLTHYSGHPDVPTPDLGKLASTLVEQGRCVAPAPRSDGAAVPPARESARPVPLRLSESYIRSAVRIMADVADAIHHCHQAQSREANEGEPAVPDPSSPRPPVGYLHCDLKPSNLMVDRDGHCWIIDFGLARYLHASRQGESDVETPSTVNGTVSRFGGTPGTPEYMAPEQYRGEGGVCSDVWGLGATLYELLTLRRAFSDPDREELRRKIEFEEPRPPRHFLANVPPDLSAICLKALCKNPAHRYPSAEAFARDLRRWLKYEPTTARRAGPLRRAGLWSRRNPGWAAAAALSVVAALLGLLTSVAASESRARTAEANTARANLAAAQADAEANEARVELREKDYQLQLARLNSSQFGRPIGWSRDLLNLTEEHYKGRPAAAKRQGNDEAALTLGGLDAVTLKSPLDPATAVAWSKDGKRLVLGGAPPTARRPPAAGGVYDVATDRWTPSQQLGTGPVAFTGDGTPLHLIPTGPFALRLWDLDRQRPVRDFAFDPKIDRNEKGPRPALAISADGKLIAASTVLPGDRPTLVVWEVATGREVARTGVRTGLMAFSPDNALLATTDDAGAVTLRPLAQPDKGTAIPGGRLPALCLAFARDPERRRKGGRDASGWLLATGEQGGAITIWDVDRKLPRTRCLGSHFDVYGVAFSPDGTLLVSAGRGAPRLWDVATGHLLLTLETRSWVPAVAFSPGARELAVSALPIFDGHGVSLYTLDHGRGVQTLRGLRGEIVTCCASTDGRYLAALSHDWQVGVWKRETGELLHVFEAPVGLTADNARIAFRADGEQLACASLDEAVLWDVPTGREVRRWDKLPPGLANLLAFHPDGKLLLFRLETEGKKVPPVVGANPVDHPRVCRLRDLLAKDPLASLAELRDLNWHVSSADCTSDGRYFVVDGTRTSGGKLEQHMIVYDGLTGKTVLDRPHANPSGSPILSGLDAAGKLLLFKLPSEKQVKVVELPSGKLQGSHPGGAAYGPELEWWLSVAPTDASGQRFGYQLFRHGAEGPLVTLGGDTITSGFPRFDAAGTHAIWGNADGTVRVGDIQEVRKKLAAVGLGW